MLTIVKKHKIITGIILLFVVLWLFLYGLPIVKMHYDNYRMKPDMEAIEKKVSALGPTKFTNNCGFVENTYGQRTTVCTMQVYTHIQEEDDESIRGVLQAYLGAIQNSGGFNLKDGGVRRLSNVQSNMIVGGYKHQVTKRECSLQHDPSRDMSESYGQPGTTVSLTCRY